MNSELLKNIIEAALLASGRPLTLSELRDLIPHRERPERKEITAVIEQLQAEFEDRGIELIEVATGFRIQIKPKMIDWLTKLWEERPPRYSRALLETLALVAYQQPITRGDIENVRGVAVSTNIMRTMMERGWVKVVGHRDVPGKPALYATTPIFLEYFGLKKLEDLPPLAEISDLDAVIPQLELEIAEDSPAALHVVIDPNEADLSADEDQVDNVTAELDEDNDDDDDSDIDAELDDEYDDDDDDIETSAELKDEDDDDDDEDDSEIDAELDDADDDDEDDDLDVDTNADSEQGEEKQKDEAVVTDTKLSAVER